MNVLKQIADLNNVGARLATEELYDGAEQLHAKARERAALAIAHSTDHLRVSIANLAYVYRRRDADRQKAEELLRSIDLVTTPGTFFGQARWGEEYALVLKYLAGADDSQRCDDLTRALGLAKGSIDDYKQAATNTLPEIVDKEAIEDRLLRTTGIASTIATELARMTEGDTRTNYQKDASRYAQQEVDGRIARGETRGNALVNAYHTLGVAQTEMARGDEVMYVAARDNLMQAEALTERNGLVLAVLRFRLGWLEYVAHPDNKQYITKRIEEVLDAQQLDHTGKWDAGVKATLKEQMLTLGRHVGPPLQERVEAFYAPTESGQQQ